MTTDTLFEARLGNGKTISTGDKGSVTEWSIDSDYMASTDAWSLKFRSNSADDRRALLLMPIELYLDGRLQLAGRVDRVQTGGEGKIVSISGRDYIADLVEGMVDTSVKITVGDRLDQAILQIFRPYGIVAIEEPEVRVAEMTGRPPSNKLPKLVQADMQDTRPTPNCGAYQFGNQIAARHGYTLQPSVNRSLISIEKPNYLQEPTFDVVRFDDGRPGSNCIASLADRDGSSFPTFAKFTGSAGGAAEKRVPGYKEWDIHDIAPALGDEMREVIEAYCAKGRRKPLDAPNMVNGELYRLMYFQDKLAKTPAQIGAALCKAAFTQLKKSLTYKATLFGSKYAKTGFTYAVNTIANVHDDVADVHEISWCFACLKKGDGDGVTSELKFLRPGSYQIDREGHGT